MFVCKKGPNFFENSRSGFGPALHRIQNGNRAIRFSRSVANPVAASGLLL